MEAMRPDNILMMRIKKNEKKKWEKRDKETWHWATSNELEKNINWEISIVFSKKNIINAFNQFHTALHSSFV